MAVVDTSAMYQGDPLSEALRLIRADTTAVFRILFRAPWGLGLERVIGPCFHFVASGSCYVEIEGEPHQLRVGSGDLVMLPTGERHWLRDHPETPASTLEQVLACVAPHHRGPSPFGGDGAATSVVCGAFTLEAWDANPIARLLPPLIHIRGADGGPPPWLAATMEQLTAENDSDAPGSRAVVRRLADLLLTQALRDTLADPASLNSRAVRALRDPGISTAIELIHRNPERRWTVGGLAGEVALSRSTFASRFRQLLGESPKSYVTRTRLIQAASILRSTEMPLAEVAERAGYSNQFSFSKAFKRAFELSPGAYRHEGSGTPAGARRDERDLTPVGS